MLLSLPYFLCCNSCGLLGGTVNSADHFTPLFPNLSKEVGGENGRLGKGYVQFEMEQASNSRLEKLFELGLSGSKLEMPRKILR
jgi:hypothetical protein